MLRRNALLALAAGPWAAAQPPAILPLREVKAGMRATGRTVFSGSKVEEFQVEILGILENAGPKQSVILARLSGGPLERTGVMQGMSGSPVYYQGRLLGAVALSFQFSKEPIAGIRPIEEMLSLEPAPPRRTALHFPYKPDLPPAAQLDLGQSKLQEISSPLWMTGFSRSTLQEFGPVLRAAGLEPVQGVSGGGSAQAAPSSARLEPGSMISVQLVTGDLAVGADGTVTHIDGRKVWAFGHRFLSGGDTEMPFARSEVLALLPAVNSSFKISNAREWLGTMTQDRSTAVAGEIGRLPDLLPVSIHVESQDSSRRNWSYQLKMVRERMFTPLLLQMAIFSAIEATERTSGLSTVGLKGFLRIDGAPDIALENVYAAEMGASQMVSAAVAAPVAAILGSDFGLRIRELSVHLTVSNLKRQFTLESAWLSTREARAGETVQLFARFADPSGITLERSTRYEIPVGAAPGALNFTVMDGPSANLVEYRQFLTAPPRSGPQLLAFLNGLHPNNKAYVRLWRATNTYQVQGENLPAPPPSVALSLGRTVTPQPNSQVATLEMDLPAAFTGSKTLQLEIKD